MFRREGLICFGLVVLTLLPYVQVRHFEFINFDDTFYITENTRVQQGLSWDNVRWAFSSHTAPGWNPFAWVAHMADCQWFGLDAGAHHLSGLLWHVLNGPLLFILLFQLTNSVWRSAFVAALFAIHPLHVESVAWISERKDVMSTFFWLLTGLAYVGYVRRPGVARYGLTLLAFAAGLLTKPMLVTLPCVLLLWDVWPLKRIHLQSLRTRQAVWLIVEKAPLFVLAVAAGVVTVWVQAEGGAVQKLGSLSLWARSANAVNAYGEYMWKMVYPTGLSVFYPHPGEAVDFVRLTCSAAVIVVCTLVALWFVRSKPYLLVGWLWYLGMLAPVIGIIQVGSQGMADRYTYLPIVGLFIAITWGVHDIARRRGMPKKVLHASAAAIIAVLTIVCANQVSYWRDSETLFAHAVEVTSNNALAHNNLGTAYHAQGRHAEAEEQFKIAMKALPKDIKAYYNMGVVRLEQKRYEEAMNWLDIALTIDEDDPDVLVNLAKVYLETAEPGEAERLCRGALESDPLSVTAHVNLGVALAKQGRLTEAAAAYVNGLKVDPFNASAHMNLANVLARAGKYAEASLHYRRSLDVDPDNAKTHFNYGACLELSGDVAKARYRYAEALRLDDSFEAAREGFARLEASAEK